MSMELSYQQRQLQLSCMYELGWCYFLQLDWEKALSYFVPFLDGAPIFGMNVELCRNSCTKLQSLLWISSRGLLSPSWEVRRGKKSICASTRMDKKGKK